MYPIILFGKEIAINPVAINIGPLKIYWYGIIIVSSFLLALLLLYRRTKDSQNKTSFGIRFDSLLDFAFGALFWGFLCARIYYVIFKADYYIKNPLEIVMIWHGGIAIYGGIIGSVLYGIYYCKKNKINFLDFADLVIPYLALAQCLGRFGNFINQEAHGGETSLPWKMGIFDEITSGYIYVHPTFIYEALVTFVTFVVLLIISKNRKFKGQIFYLYFIMYGIGRGIIEGLRTDSLMLGAIRVSQLLSVILVLAFGIIYIKNIAKLDKNLQKGKEKCK